LPYKGKKGYFHTLFSLRSCALPLQSKQAILHPFFIASAQNSSEQRAYGLSTIIIMQSSSIMQYFLLFDNALIGQRRNTKKARRKQQKA